MIVYTPSYPVRGVSVRHYGRYLILPAIALLVSLAVLRFGQFIDYERVFYPALFSSEPYTIEGFVSPRYLPLLMWPLRFLPMHASGAAWVGISTAVTAYTIYKLQGDALSYCLAFTNPLFFIFARFGNVEALVLLGLVIETRPFDVLLMAVKPQTAVLAIVKRLTEYGRRDWLILLGVTAVSFAAWGLWIAPMLLNWIHGPNHAASLDIFPWGILVGLVVIGLFWREMTMPQLAIASYLFTPFVTPSALFVPVTMVMVTFSTKYRLIVYGLLWLLAVTAGIVTE